MNPVKPSNVAQKYLKKRMLKALPAFGTTRSGEVAKDKRWRVEPTGVSGEKVIKRRSALVDDLKEVEERVRLAVLQGEEDTSKMVGRLVNWIWLDVKQLKASHAVAIGQLQVEAKANLDEMVEEHDRLGRHLMLKGYYVEEVDAIKADTYVEEGDEEKAKVVGIVDDLYGVSRLTVLDNQGDDVELPEGGSEKEVREMSLRINDLESGLARERETSKTLLSTQAELQVELDSSRSREDNVLMCNQKFMEQFHRMKEANKNREDQYVNAHFRLVKLTQVISDLTLEVEEKDIEINKGLKELAEVTKRAEKLQRQVDALAMKEIQRRCNDLNERVTRLKAKLAQTIVHAKKAEARERSGGSRTEIKAPLVRGDVVSLSSQIRELENDVSRIQGNIQKGNANLRECQHKLDVAVIREKVLEGEIKAKESLVKRKEDLLKDLPAREELNVEIRRLHTRVVDLEAMNLAESAKYITNLEEDVIYHAKVDTEIIEWKNEYARLELCLERLKARFAVMVITDTLRSDLLKVIVTYYVEEVKRLELERDILFKILSNKGCICRAKIDRGNCLGAMETQLGPQTAESIKQGRVVVARKLKARPLDRRGSIADTPSVEKNPL
ncbi:hypothetical protein GIB67_040101 [Kingdonia uniflora]|uniref:Uncharacterized protein n=1 Tax=Kingdonia uniflora TaxID=39325 RepID=A0A7J7MUU9_9MAGN|nr:hypothetical protein GIB67_040101 [Kingdonia uniflora]